MIATEKEEKQRERETTLRERVPPLQLSGLSVQELQVCADAFRSNGDSYISVTLYVCFENKNMLDCRTKI